MTEKIQCNDVWKDVCCVYDDDDDEEMSEGGSKWTFIFLHAFPQWNACIHLA